MFNSRLRWLGYVIDPFKLGSLYYKKIKQWLKKYREYELLGGTGLINKFIEVSQLLILMLKANKDITNLIAREAFSNVEFQTLLKSYNLL